MKRWIGLSLLLVPFLASAASFWDGNAALQRGDSTFESGLYAASNSFPQDTRILITNLETGKTATVTVIKRIEGQSDILVLLSPKAAEELGVSQGNLASVRVTVMSAPSTTGSQPAEQTYSQDPDLNPGVAYPASGDASAPATAQQAGTESQPSLESLPATQVPVAENTPIPTSAPETPQPEQKTVEDEAIVAAAAARSPQKKLFLPPREDEKFVYHAPGEAPVQPAVEQKAPASTSAQITAVIGEPAAAPAPSEPGDITLADALAPEESRPEEIVSAGVSTPTPGGGEQSALATPEPLPEEQGAPEPVQTEVSGPAMTPSSTTEEPRLALLAPEAPAPEQARSAQANPAETVKTTPGSASTGTAQASVTPVRPTPQLSKTAKADTYYLQLGAYATEKVAQELATSLTSTYPTLVVAPQSEGSHMFRVLIGPLNRAESGTLLTRFRYRGFPDAFLKKE
jgi:rare lipoprotein A (peptidoglycan hydrolase)